MPLPIDVIELVFNWTLANGSPGANVLWCAADSGLAPSAGELAQACTTSKTWFNTGFAPAVAHKTLCNAATSLVSVVATARGTAPQTQHVEVVGTAGTGAGPAAPNESAIVTTFYTGTPGKSYRGRAFWPGYDPDQLGTDGKLSAFNLGVYQASVQSLSTHLNSDGPANITHVVLSRLLSLTTPVGSVVARAIPHHIRKRNA